MWTSGRMIVICIKITHIYKVPDYSCLSGLMIMALPLRWEGCCNLPSCMWSCYPVCQWLGSLGERTGYDMRSSGSTGRESRLRDCELKQSASQAIRDRCTGIMRKIPANCQTETTPQRCANNMGGCWQFSGGLGIHGKPRGQDLQIPSQDLKTSSQDFKILGQDLK